MFSQLTISLLYPYLSYSLKGFGKYDKIINRLIVR